MAREATIRTEPQARKPGDKNSFWNSRIWPFDASVGPLRAIMTDPSYQRNCKLRCCEQAGRKGRTMHRAHPSQPKNDSFSLRNIEERIADITTDSAPSGVTTIASTNA